jgi:hypothetical protein
MKLMIIILVFHSSLFGIESKAKHYHWDGLKIKSVFARFLEQYAKKIKKQYMIIFQ